MGQPICQSVRGLRLHSFENSWNFTCGLTMLMKGPLDSFSLHLELQSNIPLFKALFYFFHCNADFGCSID